LSQRHIVFTSSAKNKMNVNGDSFLLKRYPLGETRDEFLLAAVADGMGGLENGKLLSNMVISLLDTFVLKHLNFTNNQLDKTSIVKLLQDASKGISK